MRCILPSVVVSTLVALISSSIGVLHAGEKNFDLHKFKRIKLTDVYFSEGANSGDINGDGKMDVVYGPHWYAGPDFKKKFEIYNPIPQNREGYANNFFSWIYDFDGNGLGDVLVVGFPGTPAYVYENPGKSNYGKHWKKHVVLDWVSNESPQFVNIVGDERPELVCTRDGSFGYAEVNWEKPFSAWTFRAITPSVTAKKFGHGLGIGDINNDGKMDIIHAKGWIEQPQKNPATSRWTMHDVSFSNSYGGAEMYAYDVDGDGDMDVITSHAAHDFGLAWYEQIRKGDKIEFKHHLIMGSHPSENRYGVLFSELHSVNLVDIDGDGLKDILTGRTYYSHHKQSPMWDAGAVVYWFRLVRGKNGVDWIPYQIHGDTGIGRQLSVADLNGDSLPDLILGGMKGGNVLIHEKISVDKEKWRQQQPKLYDGPAKPSAKGAKALRGPKTKFAKGESLVENAIEGESLKPKVRGGRVQIQKMDGFRSDRWSNNKQLYWIGGRPGDTLEFPIECKQDHCDLEMVLTCARDYGIVQLYLDDVALGKPIDLYDPNVVTTGLLHFQNIAIEKGPHVVRVQLVGANPKAAKAYMFGIDYLRVLPPTIQKAKK